jgi:hypothetical protein
MIYLLIVGCSVNQSILRLQTVVQDPSIEVFSDGWNVEINTAYSYLSDIQLQDLVTDETVFQTTGNWLVNWLDNSEPVLEKIIPSARWGLQFEHAKPNDSINLLGDIDNNIRLKMQEEDYGIWLQGQATNGEQEIDFKFGISLPILYSNCIDGNDGVEGLSLLAELNEVTINWRLEQAFYTSLKYGEETLSFQAIADADKNSDSVVESWELADVSVDELGYELDGRLADNLEQFVALSVAQGIRINDSGLCVLWPIL